MSRNDQLLVDHLYNTIFVQKIRCTHFTSVGQQYNNEKKILDNMVEKYKTFYKNKIDLLKVQLEQLKDSNISSYLTYDNEYYEDQYNCRMEELNKYIVELDAREVDHIANDKLSTISTVLDSQYPGYLLDPTLLGKL